MREEKRSVVTCIFVKSHTCEENGAHLRISFCHSLMNFEKPGKSDFWKNEKNYWRYHHFTHVYQKTQSYEIQFQRYGARQNFLPPPTPQHYQPRKPKFGENEQIIWNVIILNLRNKKHNQMMHAYLDMECHIHNCHFRPFFSLLPNYWPWKLKIGKNVKKTWIYYSF